MSRACEREKRRTKKHGLSLANQASADATSEHHLLQNLGRKRGLLRLELQPQRRELLVQLQVVAQLLVDRLLQRPLLAAPLLEDELSAVFSWG
jgi:hypothetical protein